MKKFFLILTLFLPFFSISQSNYNLTLVGEFDWNGLSYDSEGSDIWGWRNTSTGVEYALVGLNTGFSVVELSNPQNPTEVFLYLERTLHGEILKHGKITRMLQTKVVMVY